MPVAEGGYPVSAFEHFAVMEGGNYWFESRNRLIVWSMRRYFPNATTFLEVGCGTGFVLQGVHAALPDLRLTASDAADDGLRIARLRVPAASFVREDVRELDAREAFDVVGAFDVLEHIPDDQAVIARLFRAARSGGGILVTVPQHPWLWSRFDDVGRHVRRYRRKELVQRLRSVGFQIVRVTSFVSLLLPALAVSRWLDARRQSAFDWRELQVSSTVNEALAAVLSLERGTIRCGVSWPVGGSLLVVARKPAQ